MSGARGGRGAPSASIAKKGAVSGTMFPAMQQTAMVLPAELNITTCPILSYFDMSHLHPVSSKTALLDHD